MIDSICFNQEISSNCIYLVYKINDSDVIDEIEHKMITTNKIDGLLSVSYCGVDSINFYKYDISSKITLGSYLKSAVNSKKILALIMNICEACINADKYLINNENLILDKDYIYIDITSLDVYMLCLPVQISSNYDLKYFIKDLIFYLRTSEKKDLSIVSEIFDYLNNNDIMLIKDFYAFIKELSVKSTDKNEYAYNVNSDSSELGSNKVIEISTKENNTKENNIKENKIKDNIIKHNAIKDKEKNTVDNNVKDYSDKNDKKNNVLLIPDVEQKQTKTRKKAHKIQEKKTVKVYTDWKKNIAMKAKLSLSDALNSCKKLMKSAQPPKTIIQTPEQVESYVYSEKTEFFDADKILSNASPYIIRMSNDEKVFITKDIFRIGKDCTYADFIITDNPTISRAHAEIVKVDDMYYIQDNNSKNHTYVNEEAVIGSNKIKLSHNTRFRLSNEEFIFKLY